MERMYQDYKDVAEFYLIYISEAHAMDDKFPVSYAEELGIREPTSYPERCVVASRLMKDKKLTIPCLTDGMDNEVEKLYKGWPTRIYVVRTDGRLGVAAGRGPWGYSPGINAANKWLAEFKETKQEPPLAMAQTEEVDIGKLQSDLFAAYQASDYDKALDIAQKIHHQVPESVDTIYNIACMHCLLGHEEKTYTWLEKAIEAGYRDADHLLRDDDFKAIRDQDRFKNLVKGVREKSGRTERSRNESGDSASVVGEWEMKTMMGDRAIEATMSISITDGELTGTWVSAGREMKMTDIKLDGNKLTFKRSINPDQTLEYEGTVQGDRISGKYRGSFGELESNGKRKAPAGSGSAASAGSSTP